MDRSRLKYTAAAALICASVAATIGIATGAAAPSSNDKGSSANNWGEAGYAATARVPAPPPPGARRGGKMLFRAGGPIREFGGPPVHSEMVVPTKSGDDFETITQDSGKLQSVSSDQLTIVEGTDEATYKTVTLDIPSDATVIRNGKKAELGDLQEGDQVHVSQAPQKTFVYASDSEFIKNLFRHHRSLPPPPGVGGLPPGLPPMPPMARRGN
jgi:hypothetical protein